MPLVTSDQATESALKKDGIIPDVHESYHGSTLLVISYGHNKDVALGNTLAVNETQHAPQVSFLPDSPSSKYTLIFTDPDAPSRNDAKWREYRHWVVTNISPGSGDFQPANLSQGTCLTPYMGPAPPAGSGPHRYVFSLYKQVPTSNASLLTTPLNASAVKSFKTRQFASQAGLELVGVNYYFAENKSHSTLTKTQEEKNFPTASSSHMKTSLLALLATTLILSTVSVIEARRPSFFKRVEQVSDA
ncbi:hypothetical protein BGZ83_010146, partial [Gryganskiella cystojenkinii]